MNINIANYLTIIVIAYALFFAGCVEKETIISIETPTITMSPASTPEQTTESTITPATITYPNPEEVIKYVADKKHISSNEVKIVDFTRISRGSSMSPPNRYQVGGYAAVRLIAANYTSLVIAYKNSSNVFIVGDYTAITINEKNLFEMLLNTTLDFSPYGGKLIPFNITIINTSYIINKNEVYNLNNTWDFYEKPNRSPIEKPYATFEFVTDFNDFHGYWPGSFGWVDAEKKQIWIAGRPTV
jgi:hypothetical protein